MSSTNNIRKIVIYTLLCVYSFALLKPLTPIVNDVIAHAFYKMEHLATVHFENGKYHVHAELAQQAEKDNPTKNSNTPSSIFEVLAKHLRNETAALIVDRVCISKIVFPSINFPVDISVEFPTPPPKA
jgi:hypothetical protein